MQLSTRVSPEVHHALALHHIKTGETKGAFVEAALRKALGLAIK